MIEPNFISYKFNYYSSEEVEKRSADFYNEMNRRRTVRQFSKKNVPVEVIKNCIKTAGTAPSGANMQPWHFVVISNNRIKKRIRIAAEEEEKQFYRKRAPQEWLNNLAKLGTDENKPFLETAPFLIAVFEKKFSVDENGNKIKHYYTSESTGLAVGLLITSIHKCGLASLTHTPSPMNFLNKILNRPKNERPYLILVVGYPAEDAEVPDIERKNLEEISTFLL